MCRSKKSTTCFLMIVSIVLIVLIVVAGSGGVANASTVESGSFSQTVSEYNMIKDLRKCSNAKLRSLGYSVKDIREIKGKKLAAKEKYGSVTYTISYSKMYNKKGETFLNTKMTWNWSKTPACLLTDIVGMTTSEAFTKDSANAYVQYYANSAKRRKTSSSKPKVKTENSGRGVFIRIKVGRSWDHDNKSYTQVALSGNMSAKWSIGKKVKQTGISSNYGHTVISCTPQVSFGQSASISFTPTKKCKCGDEAYMKAKLK